MCGICGIWNYKTHEPVDPALLRRMTDSMSHRGPDDSGIYLDNANGVGLGFRRLAIIDLSPAGHQPMSNEDESIWLVFNGEIYNFLDMRPRLEARGHHFRSHTDTEVILHHYEERGPDGIRDLFGMFGLAIWDQCRQRMTLARDRVGKKPLYYYDNGERLIFASELKAILTDRTVPRDLNLDAVAEYLSLGYIGSPQTIFNGITKLSPGHILVHTGEQASTWCYWDWLSSFQPDHTLTEAEWIAQLQATLREAVRARMISDVPIGAFLSGGIDSSAVVAMMAGLSDRPIKTFSIGFEEQPYNELPYARQIARQFGTNHSEYIVQPEVISELLPKLAYQYDEPFGDSSALPTYYVSQIARQEVTVCLSGDGGDEALAGYRNYARSLSEHWIDHIPTGARKALLSVPLGLIPSHVHGYRTLYRYTLPAIYRHALRYQIFYPYQISAILSNEAASRVRRVPAFLAHPIRRSRDLDYVSQMQYLDQRTYLPEDILTKVDRASMLTSLEVRCPLLDHRFLELAAQIPWNLRLKNGAGKYILRQALRGIIPAEVMDRPKQGFSIPGNKWLKGESASFVSEVLLSKRFAERGIFRPEAVRTLVSQNLSPGTGLWSNVWLLLMFELWCRAYLD